jgi:hypothetical protein
LNRSDRIASQQSDCGRGDLGRTQGWKTNGQGGSDTEKKTVKRADEDAARNPKMRECAHRNLKRGEITFIGKIAEELKTFLRFFSLAP